MNEENLEWFVKKIQTASSYLASYLPQNFIPLFAFTLGSGLSGVAASVRLVSDPIPYNQVPGFLPTTVEGHEGNILFGYIHEVPIMVFQGRKHYYELCGISENPLLEITFPVYVARSMGASIYFATNAAGGLNSLFKPADVMILTSHFGFFFPNPLVGPVIPLFHAERFVAQDKEYDKKLNSILEKAAENLSIAKHVHMGTYAAITGPTFESNAEVKALRTLGIDAVGMSTVPEIIVATSIGMKTIGASLITNVIDTDGTNTTSHEEVNAALNDPVARKRTTDFFEEFFKLVSQERLVK